MFRILKKKDDRRRLLKFREAQLNIFNHHRRSATSSITDSGTT